MKKLASTLALTALFGLSAQADFTRIEAGAGMWQADPSGDMTYITPALDQTVDIQRDLGYTENDFTYVWLNIKHPVPVIPNLRLEKMDFSYSATNTLTRDFTWEGTTYTTSTTVNSSLQMDQTDVILYYNLLDETAWMTLDLGLDIKLMDLEFDLTDGVTSYSESEDVPLPMLYARGRVNVPGTDLAIEGDIKYIGYSDSKFYDARVKVDYTLNFVPVVQPALEVGYRVQKLEIDEDDLEFKTDIEFSGIYAGLMLRF